MSNEVGFEIFVPTYVWDVEEERYIKQREAVVTRDRLSPDMLILDLGGDIKEIYFKEADFLKAARMVEYN